MIVSLLHKKPTQLIINGLGFFAVFAVFFFDMSQIIVIFTL